MSRGAPLSFRGFFPTCLPQAGKIPETKVDFPAWGGTPHAAVAH